MCTIQWNWVWIYKIYLILSWQDLMQWTVWANSEGAGKANSKLGMKLSCEDLGEKTSLVHSLSFLLYCFLIVTHDIVPIFGKTGGLVSPVSVTFQITLTNAYIHITSTMIRPQLRWTLFWCMSLVSSSKRDFGPFHSAYWPCDESIKSGWVSLLRPFSYT